MDVNEAHATTIDPDVESDGSWTCNCGATGIGGVVALAFHRNGNDEVAESALNDLAEWIEATAAEQT